MIFNNSVTLYQTRGNHLERKYFKRACVVCEKKLEQANGSAVESGLAAVRIFTAKEQDILPGDRFVIGISGEKSVPEEAYLILSVKKNFGTKKSMCHYKITAV